MSPDTSKRLSDPDVYLQLVARVITAGLCRKIKPDWSDPCVVSQPEPGPGVPIARFKRQFSVAHLADIVEPYE